MNNMLKFFTKSPKAISLGDSYYVATQWQLIIRKFKKHKVAHSGFFILAILYFVAIFCEFFATYDMMKRETNFILAPPSRVHLFHKGKFIGPFVYDLTLEIDPHNWQKIYVEKKDNTYHKIGLFVKSDQYLLWGLIKSNIHFFGTKDQAPYFVFGTDQSGRDLFSRVLSGLRVSLTVGLVGVFFTFLLGCTFDGLAGYYGGIADLIVSRIVEFLQSMPSIPLWMALAAALPKEWSTMHIYFMITIILSLMGWTGLARIVRGKLLQMRDEDYVMAARLSGGKDSYLIRKHLLPGFMSYLIVNITIAVPHMILGETSLSFLGIGLRPPVVSLGVLLKDAQNVNAIALSPWLMIPGAFIIVIVLAFNFLGDGLRDAADPYK
jgi:peptide/nickel transport system permease protein